MTGATGIVTRPHMVVFGLLLAVVTAAAIGRGNALAHNHQYGNCANRYWLTTPPDQHIYQMVYDIAIPHCYGVPANTAYQTTFYGHIPDSYWGVGGSYWAYARHESDETVQHQLDGPTCKSVTGWPSCSGNWKWWGYWYFYNPSGWWQQQQNTYAGGPYWHRQGYY